MMQQPNVVGCLGLVGGPGTYREIFSAVELAVYDNGPFVYLLDGVPSLQHIMESFKQSILDGMIDRRWESCMRLVSSISDFQHLLPSICSSEHEN